MPSMSRTARTILSLSIIAVTSMGMFMTFTGFIIVDERGYRMIYALLCILFLAASGSGFLMLIESFSARRMAAWCVLMGSIIILGMTFYYFERTDAWYGPALTHILPFPCFSLICWGGYHLTGSRQVVSELKTPPVLVWGYLGILGGSIVLIIMDPLGRFVFHDSGSTAKIVIYAAGMILEIALPLYWFLKVNPETRL